MNIHASEDKSYDIASFIHIENVFGNGPIGMTHGMFVERGPVTDKCHCWTHG